MAIDYNYKSAADYYRDAGEEEQLKAMKDCGLLDEDDDGEDILYYANSNEFDPYEKTLHTDYGFTYDDPDDERICFPDGEEFDILDSAGDESFWDKYEEIFKEREKEKMIENVTKMQERSNEMSNSNDSAQKAMLASATALLNNKIASVTNNATQANGTASGKRTIIANITEELKRENPALAYNTIDKMSNPGKRRMPAIDLVKKRAEDIYNQGFTSLADYQRANGINVTGTNLDIATPNAPINTAVGTIIPGVEGGMKVVTDNMKTVGTTPKAPLTAGVVPPIINSTQPVENTTTVNTGLGKGLNPSLRNKMVGTVDLKTFAKTIEQPKTVDPTPVNNVNTTPIVNTNSVTNAAIDITGSTQHTIPDVVQPITQPIFNQDVAAIEAKENIDLDSHIDSIKNIYNREAIKTPENHMEMLQKHGYIAEEQNKKVFKSINVNKIINNRKELDTPRLATARMSYRKLEKDLAICVLDSGIPADKIDTLMELFNAIGVGESFALAVEQVANERANLNQPLLGELKSLYNPYDLAQHVQNLTEITEPVLSKEANRIMSVNSQESFVFASVKKSQVLDVLDFINKNGLFISFTDDETKMAYAELANACLYNKFDVRSYENWKSIIYYIISVMGIKDTLIREYYISAFGDVPENDKNNNLGGIMNNQTFRPTFNNGVTTATPGMITTPGAQQPTTAQAQDITVASTLAGLQNIQPGVGQTMTTPANPMTGAQVIQPVQNMNMQTQTTVQQPLMQNQGVMSQTATPNMVQNNTPRPISAMPMNIQTGTLYGGQTPTVPAGVGSMVNNIQTQQSVAPQYVQPQQNMMNQQQIAAPNVQPIMQPNAIQQPMIAAPAQYVQQNQYTQPMLTATAPVVGAQTNMMNNINNQMGGMNQMNGMMNNMNMGYNPMMGNQMNMMNGGMNNMMRTPVMPVSPVNGMGMNQMVGMGMPNNMMNQNPMMGYNPMMNMNNQMNMMPRPMMPQTNLNPMMNQMNPMFNNQINPMMPNMMNQNPMMNQIRMTPMMNNGMNMMNQVNPMMSGMNMGINPMMNNQMNMGYNPMMMMNNMMPRPLGAPNLMNNMMGAGYNQNTIYNRVNPMMNPMMNQNPMMNNGMNMMGQMTGATINPMMNNQMGMNMMNTAVNPMMNMTNMAYNPMMNQNPMMGYGYMGF